MGRTFSRPPIYTAQCCVLHNWRSTWRVWSWRWLDTPIMFVSRNPCPRTLPTTPRNKNLSKVFLPLYDGNEGPTPQPTQLTCGPSYFDEFNGGNPRGPSGTRREAGT